MRTLRSSDALMNFPLFHFRRAGFLVGALLVALLAGCAHGNLYEGFHSDLEQLAGAPLSDARISHIGPLLERTPDAVRPLVNGHEIWVYEIASEATLAKPHTATVFVQVNPKAKRVVQASCRGYFCRW